MAILPDFDKVFPKNLAILSTFRSVPDPFKGRGRAFDSPAEPAAGGLSSDGRRAEATLKWRTVSNPTAQRHRPGLWTKRGSRCNAGRSRAPPGHRKRFR
jgi:hypothetical protein